MSIPLTVKERMQIPRQAMPEQDATARAANFLEVNLGFTEPLARREADRCLQCKPPHCVQGCPVGVPIRDFIRRVALEDFSGAADLIRTRNGLPATCGRGCPGEHQCEAQCSVLATLEPVGIGRTMFTQIPSAGLTFFLFSRVS